MTDILDFIDQLLEEAKNTLDNGESNPIKITFVSKNKPVIYFKTLSSEPLRDKDFMHRLTEYPKAFPEIDAGYMVAIAKISSDYKVNDEDAFILGYCTKNGEIRAFKQPFSIIFDDTIIYGEKEEITGKHNFCEYLLIAFNIKR